MINTIARGKTLNGEWVEGVALFAEGRAFIFSEFDILDEQNKLQCMLHEVVSESVGYYTGRNIYDIKVFQGDIIDTYYDYDDSFGCPTTDVVRSVVLWDKENYMWALKTDQYVENLGEATWDNVVIVGNTYDNPELLKAEAE